MPFGTKKVYLPNFTLALVRTPHLPPNYAQFIVPLNINKLDLKDYLLHAYNVEVLSVRSFIQHQNVRRAKDKDLYRPKIEWYRPRAIKKMTVELKEPFVYPPEPEDLSP
ncbi:ribosomal protein L25/L23 [Tuber brumale]|nr:ribosomal protein L25/L23 [Tuber brumale]